jgi:hypothetical protein
MSAGSSDARNALFLPRVLFAYRRQTLPIMSGDFGGSPFMQPLWGAAPSLEASSLDARQTFEVFSRAGAATAQNCSHLKIKHGLRCMSAMGQNQ